MDEGVAVVGLVVDVSIVGNDRLTLAVRGAEGNDIVRLFVSSRRNRLVELDLEIDEGTILRILHRTVNDGDQVRLVRNRTGVDCPVDEVPIVLGDIDVGSIHAVGHVSGSRRDELRSVRTGRSSTVGAGLGNERELLVVLRSIELPDGDQAEAVEDRLGNESETLERGSEVDDSRLLLAILIGDVESQGLVGKDRSDLLLQIRNNLDVGSLRDDRTIRIILRVSGDGVLHPHVVLHVGGVPNDRSVGTVDTGSTAGGLLGIDIVDEPIAVLTDGDHRGVAVSTLGLDLGVGLADEPVAVGTDVGSLAVLAVRTLGLDTGIGVADPPVAVLDVRAVALLTSGALRTIADDVLVTVAERDFVTAGVRGRGGDRSDLGDYSASVDRLLQPIYSIGERRNIIPFDRLVEGIDLLLQCINVGIVVRTRYGYTRETQNEGPCKEQIFNFFVHS